MLLRKNLKMNIDDKTDSKIEYEAERIVDKDKRDCVYKHDFGICGKCIFLIYKEYELKGYEAYCRKYEYSLKKLIPIDEGNKVIVCSEFMKRGEVGLMEMKELAWELNFKEKVGFKGGKK